MTTSSGEGLSTARKLDALDARLERIEALLTQRLTHLECDSADHETRLRALGDESTRLKTTLGLAQAAQAALTLLLTAALAWLRR